MDNKQDRQFFWKVKDFLNTSHQPKPMADKTSLRDAASKILASNIKTAVNEVKNTSSDIQSQANQMLNLHAQTVNKQRASTQGHANNITANLFNLNEQMYSQTMSGAGSLKQTRKGFYYTPKPLPKQDTSVSSSSTSTEPEQINPTQQAMQTFTGFKPTSLSLGQIKPNSAVVGVKPQANTEGSVAGMTGFTPPSMGTEVDVSMEDLEASAKKAESNKAMDPKLQSNPLIASTNQILFGLSKGAYR
jgi:hypothetical protein